MIHFSLILNCIGAIKQVYVEADEIIYLNSVFPRKLSHFCSSNKSKLIHFSTDCVFSGKKGNYDETDFPDALDLYGRSKLLEKLIIIMILQLELPLIGHELNSSVSLVDWFLSQKVKLRVIQMRFFQGCLRYM